MGKYYKLENFIQSKKEILLIKKSLKMVFKGNYKSAMDNLGGRSNLEKRLIESVYTKFGIDGYRLLPFATPATISYFLEYIEINDLPSNIKINIIKKIGETNDCMKVVNCKKIIDSYENCGNSIGWLILELCDIKKIDHIKENYKYTYCKTFKHLILSCINKNINEIPNLLAYYNNEDLICLLPDKSEVISLVCSLNNIDIITKCLAYDVGLRDKYIDLLKSSKEDEWKKDYLILNYAIQYDNSLLKEFSSLEYLFLAIDNLKISDKEKNKMVLEVYKIIVNEERDVNYQKYIDEATRQAKEKLDSLIKPGIFSNKK